MLFSIETIKLFPNCICCKRVHLKEEEEVSPSYGKNKRNKVDDQLKDKVDKKK